MMTYVYSKRCRMVLLSVVKQNRCQTILLYYLLLSSAQCWLFRTVTTVTKYICYRCTSGFRRGVYTTFSERSL